MLRVPFSNHLSQLYAQLYALLHKHTSSRPWGAISDASLSGQQDSTNLALS